MSIPLEQSLQAIKKYGPDRVVVNADGYAVSGLRARRDYEIMPDVIFIRGDGWTLGAPKEFAAVAFGIWFDSWVGFVLRAEPEKAKPISEYRLG